MSKFKEKPNTHIVIKRADVLTLITAEEALQLANIMQKIEDKRYEQGKKIRQSYLVVNKDEPYAKDVYEIIKEGELEKEEALFDKDPRFCKVCGCSSDHACPGGCHWVTYDLCSNCVFSIFTCEALVDELGNLDAVPGTEDYLADEITSEEICEGYVAGHAAALGLSSEAEDTALNLGDRVRVYTVYQHSEIIKQIVYVLEPKKE